MCFVNAILRIHNGLTVIFCFGACYPRITIIMQDCSRALNTHGKRLSKFLSGIFCRSCVQLQLFFGLFSIFFFCRIQGLYSLSGKTSYRQISWSLEAARLDVIIIAPLWNLTGTSAALLPRGCQISERLKKSKPESRDFKTSRDLEVRRLTA